MATGMLLIILSSSILLHFAHTGREFFFVDTHKDWTSAQTYCREKFTDLVTVYNEQENQRLMALTENNNVNIWIGLRHNLDFWVWSMGEPTLSVSKHDAIWGVDQPDNTDGNQHCAQVSTARGEGVFDRKCSDPFNFICFDGNAAEKYILSKASLTWFEAQDDCRTKHDDLASVSDVTVLQKLLEMMKAASSTYAWIGLYRAPWRTWSDNSSTNFDNWETRPTIYSTDDHCGCLSTATGKWHASLCQNSYPFFCYSDNLRTKRQTILKMRLQSGVDLNNVEIQHQILEQMKNRLRPVAGANLTVKWRATTETTNPVRPATNKTVPIKCD